jgi:arylformamidase
MRYAGIVVCLAAGVVGMTVTRVGAAPCPTPAHAVQTSSAVYGADTNFEALDAYLPTATSNEPVILFVHGGGWTRGDKSQYRTLGETFAACGIAFVALNYPLSPQARADAEAADIDKAVKWALDNATAKGYSRTKVFVMGHGAGAQLATLAAVDQKFLAGAGVPTGGIAGVIALEGEGYEPSQAATAASDPRYRSYAMAFGADPSQWKQYDCNQFLKGGEPRFLVVHGVDDYLASAAASQALVADLTRAHDTVTYLEPVGHDYSGVLVDMTREPDDPVLTAIAHFVSGA